MQRFKIYILCLVLGAFVFSCKKEHITPEGTNGTPVFYFNGDVDGSPVSLHAGVNNYYMYSSDSQSTAGVYSYMGNLKEFGCNSGCVSSIKFILNDYRTLGSGASEPNINHALAAGSYIYLTNGSTVNTYSITFTPSIGAGSSPITSFTFNYGDGTDTSGSVLPSKFTHIYSPLAHYSTNLSVKFTDGNTSAINLPLATATPKDSGGNAIASVVSISHISGYTLTFKDALTPSSISGKVLWNFGDSSSGSNTASYSFTPISGDSGSHTYHDNLLHIVTARVINAATNDTVDAALGLVPDTTGSPSYNDIVNYSTSAPTLLPNPQSLSYITIVYTDPAGHVYSSADSAQHVGGNFQILSVSNYQNNENNQTTKQLHIKFNCTLYDGLGKSVTITNGDAVIAVAYK